MQLATRDRNGFNESDKNLQPLRARLLKHASVAGDLVSLYGARKFFGEIVPWLFWRRYIFLSQLLDNLVRSPPPQLPFRLELATEKDIPQILALRPHFYSTSLLQSRLRQGHLCFLGWSDEQLLRISWVFVGAVYLPYLHRTLLLSPLDVFGDDAYSHPSFRKKGVQSHARYLTRLAVRDMGYRRYTGATASWHSKILKRAGKHGWQEVGMAGYVGIFGFRKYFWEGAVTEHDRTSLSLNIPP